MLKMLKIRPGVLRKLNWKAPLDSLAGSLKSGGVATMLSGLNNSVEGPVSALLKPPATSTLPLGSRAVMWSRRPLTNGRVGSQRPVAGSYKFGPGWIHAAIIALSSGNQHPAVRQ